LVGAQGQAERGVGLGNLQTHRAAGIRVEPRVGKHLRGRDGEREGRQRQIEAAEPQGGKAEQESRAKAHRTRDRNRDPIRDAELRHQNRRPIAADGEEGAVTERYLAIEAGQQIEPQKSDSENQHLCGLVEMVTRGEEWKDKRENRDGAVARASCRPSSPTQWYCAFRTSRPRIPPS